MFYLTTQSTHFSYRYMAPDVLSVSLKEEERKKEGRKEERKKERTKGKKKERKKKEERRKKERRNHRLEDSLSSDDFHYLDANSNILRQSSLMLVADNDCFRNTLSLTTTKRKERKTRQMFR